MEKTYVVLKGRAVLRLTGEDRIGFLQGLVSNDVRRCAEGRAIWAALLTPQGKFLHEFFCAPLGDALLLDGEAGERRDDLRTRMGRFKLRAKIALDPADGWVVVAAFGDGAARALSLPADGGAVAFGGGVAFADPRLDAAGARLILPESGLAALADAGFAQGGQDDYDALRLSLGLPDGSRDIEVEKNVLLECGFEELRGVDFKKGCYMGQEVTARTKYRGLVKKRLIPVAIDGPLPAPGTPVVVADDGREVGEVRSGLGAAALAQLRLEVLGGGPALTAGGATVIPRLPDWMVVPDAADEKT